MTSANDSPPFAAPEPQTWPPGHRLAGWMEVAWNKAFDEDGVSSSAWFEAFAWAYEMNDVPPSRETVRDYAIHLTRSRRRRGRRTREPAADPQPHIHAVG